MPKVEVEGAGTLSLPVPDSQIATLIRQAERAPYGRGNETIVDAAVRKVWQIAFAKVALEQVGPPSRRDRPRQHPRIRQTEVDAQERHAHADEQNEHGHEQGFLLYSTTRSALPNASAVRAIERRWTG